MSTLYLTEIRRDPERAAFHLTWTDGHTATVPYSLVRGYCPCASCQGHGDGVVTFRPPTAEVKPTTVAPVGNYAISIGWSDGHATGIFRFDYLRALCPCPACGDLAPDDEPPPIDTARL